MYYTNIKNYEHLVHYSQNNQEPGETTIVVVSGIIAAIVSISILLFNNFHQAGNIRDLSENGSNSAQVVINQDVRPRNFHGNLPISLVTSPSSRKAINQHFI